MYVGILWMGCVNVPNETFERKTYNICSSVLLEVPIPERNTTAENWNDWMKLCRFEMNSSLRLWGEGCQEIINFTGCHITLSTGDLC